MPLDAEFIVINIKIQDFYGEGWASVKSYINKLPVCDKMTISPNKEGKELITLFVAEV